MPWFLGALLFVGFDPTVLTIDLTTVSQNLTTRDLIGIATSSAEKYHLTPKQTRRMLKTIQCESGWDNSAVGPVGEVGLIQFYPPAHTDLTREQMTNVYFELNWMAEQVSFGNGAKLWTCWRLLFS